MAKKSSIIKAFLLADLLLGIALAAWSSWRWNDCGYDCGLFGVNSGPPAILGWYAGVAMAVLAGLALVWMLLRRRNP